MSRGSLALLLLAALSFISPSAFAQSQPQFLRDYIYGPGGKLIATAEPDSYGPTAVMLTGTWGHHACISYSAYLTWTVAADLGSGIAGYKLYRNSVLLVSTTSLNYTDNTVAADTSYSYDVYAYDNAGNLGADANTEVDVGDCLSEELLAYRVPSLTRSLSSFETSIESNANPIIRQSQLKPSIRPSILRSARHSDYLFGNRFASWRPLPNNRFRIFTGAGTEMLTTSGQNKTPIADKNATSLGGGQQ